MLKSYYEILNVDEKASKQEIKFQFKKLAKMYHPDLNSSLEAENIFKEINKAAEVLLDDEKRKNYDLLRQGEIFQKKYTKKYSSGCGFEDLFKNKKEKDNTIKQTPQNGQDITVNITIDYSEAILGTQRVINIARSIVCPRCEGKKFANGQKCSYCNGLGEKTENRKITVKIPQNVKNKAKLRLKGEGQYGKYGGLNGNLYVIVNVDNNDELKIKDDIVYYDAQISPYLAVLGGNLDVPTLWGQATIKLPPLTKTNQSFKLINVGVLNDKTGKKGDEIVKILIQIPSSLSDEEYMLYEKLRELNLKKKNAKTFEYKN